MSSHTHYYDIKGFNDYGILVPRTVPIEIVVRMVAAVLSYELSLTMNYTLETYGRKLEVDVRAQHQEEK